MIINQEFSTFDLGLASVLVTFGYQLLKLEKSNPKKVKFIFKREKDIEQIISDYWDDKLQLPAQTLLNNQKLLKNRIYSDA